MTYTAQPTQRVAAALVALIVSTALAGCDDEPDAGADAGAAAPEAQALHCGAPTIDSGDGPYYELLDLERGAVWGTPSLTPEAFAALELPAGYVRNPVGETDGGVWLRSPGCAEAGAFTEETIAGVRWQHVVDLVEPGLVFDDAGLLTGGRVEVDRRFDFAADRVVPVLTAPDGRRYLRTSREAGRAADRPTVPSGWTLFHWRLDAPLTVALTGTVDNLRGDNGDAFQGPLPAELDLAGVGARTSIRGRGTCELLELALIGDQIGFRVWNDGFMHQCPDAWLATVDRERYTVAAPRWRSVDALEALDDDDSVIGAPTPIVMELPGAEGQPMQFAAEVGFAPISAIEEQLGVEIEDLDDIPPMARAGLMQRGLGGESYQVAEVQRAQFTRMTHYAGAAIFTLSDGACRYAMKYYTGVVDPALDDEATIATLGERFERLPEGYSFEVITLEDDLVITDVSGVAHVLTDEFNNSYDRYACD